MLKDLEQFGQGQVQCNTIPRLSKHLTMSLFFKPSNKMHMMLVGFKAITVFGRQQSWKWELDGEDSSIVTVTFY